MHFEKIKPSEALKTIVECYWIVKNDVGNTEKQKIIPDGFPEIIFHFGDFYRISLNDGWQSQALSLVAGQITHHFFLENSGRIDILGIKLRPPALHRLTQLPMDRITNQVWDLSSAAMSKLHALETELRTASEANRINLINEELLKLTEHTTDNALDEIIIWIEGKNGLASLAEISDRLHVSERQCERIFKKWVGLSPKQYCRIIQFNYIFKIAPLKISWSELGLETGYYDQSHFIRSFREFSGEDPSSYFFEKDDLANFFLKK